MTEKIKKSFVCANFALFFILGPSLVRVFCCNNQRRRQRRHRRRRRRQKRTKRVWAAKLPNYYLPIAKRKKNISKSQFFRRCQLSCYFSKNGASVVPEVRRVDRQVRPLQPRILLQSIPWRLIRLPRCVWTKVWQNRPLSLFYSSIAETKDLSWHWTFKSICD